MSVSRADILEVLSGVTDPVSGRSLVDADLVRALTVEDGRVRFVMESR